jgi:hypothetical protein
MCRTRFGSLFAMRSAGNREPGRNLPRTTTPPHTGKSWQTDPAWCNISTGKRWGPGSGNIHLAGTLSNFLNYDLSASGTLVRKEQEFLQKESRETS